MGVESENCDLTARDHKSVGIISSMLQDAIIISGMMYYDSLNKQFKALVYRFCWESLKQRKNKKEHPSRIYSQLSIGAVEKVEQININQHRLHHIYCILALTCNQDNNELIISCAEKSAIKFDVSSLQINLCDKTDSVPTHIVPCHVI